MWSFTNQTTCVFLVRTVGEGLDMMSEADMAYEGRNDAEKAIWSQCERHH